MNQLSESEIDELSRRLTAVRRDAPPSVLRIAKFIDENRVTALASSASQLAARLGTSDASVVRAVKALGFDGLPHLKTALAEALERGSTPAADMRRTLKEVGGSADHAIEDVLKTHAAAIAELSTSRSRQTITAAVRELSAARRLATFGIGPSAHLARYVSAMLNRCGRDAFSLDATGLALADQLLALREGDGLLVLSYGHPYREVLATLRESKRLGLHVVLVTDDPKTALRRFADVVLPARRGRRERAALHAITLAALEAVVLGLAACDKEHTVSTLDRLNDLRSAVSGTRVDIA